MKKIILLIAAGVIFLGISGASAEERDEKRAFEKIEVLFLEEDYAACEAKCDRFLRDFRPSRYKNRVLSLKERAMKKSGSPDDEEFAQNQERAKEIFYIIQMGAFNKYGNALKLKKKLSRKGFDSVITRLRDGKKVCYRVRAGKFRDPDNAAKLAGKLKKKGFSSEIINEE